MNCANTHGDSAITIAGLRGNHQITSRLLDNGADITQEWIEKVAGRNGGRELLQLLFTKKPDLAVTEDIVIGVLTHNCSMNSLEYLLDLYHGDPTEGIVVAAVFRGFEQSLFRKYSKSSFTDSILGAYMNRGNPRTLFDNIPDIKLAESIFIALCKNRWLDPWLLESGFDLAPDLKVTDEILIAVTSSFWTATECTNLLLEKYSDVAISEAVLTSAVS